jgi:predicted RNA-binding Zn-ribbon protein involved in translation (DUF1610 family)
LSIAPATETARPQFPCDQCGAKLEFAPGTSSLKCPYCGYENPIDTEPDEGEAAVEELDFQSQLAELEAGADTEESLAVKCSACAAELTTAPNLTSFSCPFCGTNIVATAHSRKQIKPRSLLPFHVKRDEAYEAFRRWLRKLWFAPSAVKRMAALEHRLAGLYMPAWTYDCRTITDYRGYRGDHYYVTVGSGKNRRTVRRTRWRFRSGTVRNAFDDVLVLASHSLPPKLATSLEPWDLKALVPYQDDYLSGFSAESYQIDVAQGFDLAKGIMDPVIRSTVCRDIGGDVQRIESLRIDYQGITFKHLLLPVWVSAYRYKARVYRFLVNARTGEVQGDRPWSWVKILLAVLAGAGLIGVIAAVVHFAQAR